MFYLGRGLFELGCHVLGHFFLWLCGPRHPNPYIAQGTLSHLSTS